MRAKLAWASMTVAFAAVVFEPASAQERTTAM